jgi:antitoxin component HigA of HigAB toxin-antitoxin module
MLNYKELKELKESLPHGTITEVAKEFKVKYNLVSLMINGKRKQDNNLIMDRLIEISKIDNQKIINTLKKYLPVDAVNKVSEEFNISHNLIKKISVGKKNNKKILNRLIEIAMEKRKNTVGFEQLTNLALENKKNIEITETTETKQIKKYLPYNGINKIAKEFGVSHTLISHILHKKRKNTVIFERLINLALENKNEQTRNKEKEKKKRGKDNKREKNNITVKNYYGHCCRDGNWFCRHVCYASYGTR